MNKHITKKEIIDIIVKYEQTVLKDFYTSKFEFKKGKSNNHSFNRRCGYNSGDIVDVIAKDKEKEITDFTRELIHYLDELLEDNLIELDNKNASLFVVFKEKKKNHTVNKPLDSFFNKTKKFNNCFIYAKPNLKEFKENGYRTTEQIELEQERKFREKANKRSLIVSIFAITIPLLIFTISTTIEYCIPKKPTHIIIDNHNLKKQSKENPHNTKPTTGNKIINNTTQIQNTVDTTNSTNSDSIPSLLK